MDFAANGDKDSGVDLLEHSHFFIVRKNAIIIFFRLWIFIGFCVFIRMSEAVDEFQK